MAADTPTLANVLYASGQREQALERLYHVLELDRNFAEAWNNLGVLLFFRDDCAQAVPHLRAAVKLQPTLAKTQALLGMCEKRIGETGRAEADLMESLPRLQEAKLKVQTGIELIELYLNPLYA